MSCIFNYLKINIFNLIFNAFTKIFERRDTLKNPPYWMLKILGNQSNAGINVSQNNADTLAAYYACRLLLSNTMAVVPLNVRHQHADGTREVDKNHPAYRLLAKNPNPFQTSFIWRSAHMQNVIDFGNSYSIILRNAYGNPIQLSSLPPGIVERHRHPPDAI